MARIPVLTTAEVRAVEAANGALTPSLMERAGSAIAQVADDLTATGPVLLAAGPGNNGGDAWVAARLLARNRQVIVLDVSGTEPKAAEARAARTALRSSNARITREWPSGPSPALIVDGLLGIGLTREVDSSLAALIDRINGAGCPVLAIDVPSGLDGDTGNVRGVAVRATRTLTFIAHKPGLHTQDGPDHCGDVMLEDLGLDAATQRAGHGSLLTAASVRGWLPPRMRNAHKGHFGTLGIVGGASGLVGAALLAARAAVLCGAGKTRLSLVSSGLCVDGTQPEVMITSLDDALTGDVLLIGPGGGAMEEPLLRALALAVPLVIDADALNSLARESTLREAIFRRTSPTLLTPHPGEAGRLLAIKTVEVQADRLGAALEIAKTFNATVVLKGTGSICATPNGQWSVNTTGNPGLASGGTGDVLAGMMGALLAQRMEPWEALQYAVCLHGAAADALVARGVGPIGMTASEVALEARSVLNSWNAKA